MNDFIKREDAIEALTAEFYITGRENARTILNYLDLVKTRIKAIPSADRPQGEWVSEGRVYPPTNAYHSAYCSHCGEWSEYLTDYCGNCGADMREREGE